MRIGWLLLTYKLQLHTKMFYPPRLSDHPPSPKKNGVIAYARDQNKNAAVDYIKPRVVCRWAVLSSLLSVSCNEYVAFWIASRSRGTNLLVFTILLHAPIFLMLVAFGLSIFSLIRRRNKKRNIGILWPVVAFSLSVIAVYSWRNTLVLYGFIILIWLTESLSSIANPRIATIAVRFVY